MLEGTSTPGPASVSQTVMAVAVAHPAGSRSPRLGGAAARVAQASIHSLNCSPRNKIVYCEHVPGPHAELGDVYWVYRRATVNEDAFGDKRSRPCGCVAPRPDDSSTWTALPRVTTDIKPKDLRSPAVAGIGLDKDGAWSLRWIHQVYKSKTGSSACAFMGVLPDDQRSALLTFYRARLDDAERRR